MLPEILAPAGDEPALAAALRAGANAVYFGLDEGLNARARAANFPVAGLGATCDRIHRAGARAYLTLNTVVFEDELPFLEGLLRAAAAAGIDAVIVQDPAVALLARAIAPTLHVHASTQMTISSPEAARFAAALGCVRIVVPRELSTKEIRAFAEGTPLELEVFVHGALCVSWSGQCLTSEAWGGRSANRGQCAQSCRLPYGLVVDGQLRDTQDVRYLLSPLDQSAFRALPELVDIGVASLKIEGRLKGPAYVATAVEGYRRGLDAIATNRQGSPSQPERTVASQGEAPFSAEAEQRRMALTYSRGFSPGFFEGSDHQTLVEGRFPKHRGVLLGEVVDVTAGRVRVRPAARTSTGGVGLGVAPSAGTVETIVVAPGMGVGFDTGHPESEEPGGTVWTADRTGGDWVLSFGRDNRSIASVRAGHRVWITGDPRLEPPLDAPDGRIPVDVHVSGGVGEPLFVKFTAGFFGGGAPDHALRATAPFVEGRSEQALGVAERGGLDAELLASKLCTFGGTPFRLGALTVDLEPGLHLPVSALKSLRRALVPELEAAFYASFRHAVDPEPAAGRVRAEARAVGMWTSLATTPDGAGQSHGNPRCEAAELIPLCRTDAQLDAVIASGLPYVELDWMELVGLGRAVDRARAAGLRVGIATTRVHKPGEEAYDRRIAALRPDAVLVRHWAGMVSFAEGAAGPGAPEVHGDFSLNVTNSVTAHQLLAQGLRTLTAAHDLDETQLLAVLANVPAERLTVVAHHHISAFHTEHCVYAHTLSTGRDFRTCGRPCETHRLALRDPAGLDHPVIVDVGCRNTVFEARAQSAARVVPGLIAQGVRRFRVELVWESAAETAVVLAAYRGLLAGALEPAEVVRRVAAHEQFGVTSGTMRTMA